MLDGGISGIPVAPFPFPASGIFIGTPPELEFINETTEFQVQLQPAKRLKFDDETRFLSLELQEGPE